jgi:hypothetical protein
MDGDETGPVISVEESSDLGIVLRKYLRIREEAG